MSDKSAFPFPYPGEHGQPVQMGMTFREWQWTQFAAAALPATYKGILNGPQFAEVAHNAMQMADAMMAAICEREKEEC